jgi:hypothetical protein
VPAATAGDDEFLGIALFRWDDGFWPGTKKEARGKSKSG